MSEWTDSEYGALRNFLGMPGVLRSALEKFTEQLADDHRAQCANYMASVPRDVEQASDHAAKAQVLSEFWDVLADVLMQEHRELPPTEAL